MLTTLCSRFPVLVPAVLTAALLLPALSAHAQAKVESEVLAPADAPYWVSPRGQHVAAVVLRGSRMTIAYDGVPGPPFDEVIAAPEHFSRAQYQKVVFSDDGAHYAYVARLGQEFVVVTDGKESGRGPWVQGVVTDWGFGPGGKHFFFVTHRQVNGGRDSWQIVMDGHPGPISILHSDLVFSPDGARYAYIQFVPDSRGAPTGTLVLDGKPAGYPMPGQTIQEVRFSSDGLHVFVQVPGAQATDVLADGKPFIRASSILLYPQPAGSGLLAVVTVRNQNGDMNFLTAGNKRIAGSDCAGIPGIKGVYFSPDGKHFAARCQDQSGAFWMMVDGKKGQSYQGISDAIFTADGRAVYVAANGGMSFVVVGDQESNGYQSLITPVDGKPGSSRNDGQPYSTTALAVSGNRIGFVAMDGSMNRAAVVDGKPIVRREATDLAFSPDGSRYAFVFNDVGGGGAALNVDGADVKGKVLSPFMSVSSPTWTGGQTRFLFSPDSKHIAFFGSPVGSQNFGLVMDGKFVGTSGRNVREPVFTPDSRHLAWIAFGRTNSRWGIYVDGVPVLEVEQTGVVADPSGNCWSMGADGVLTAVIVEQGSVKRVRITPGNETSVDTMLAKGR